MNIVDFLLYLDIHKEVDHTLLDQTVTAILRDLTLVPNLLLILVLILTISPLLVLTMVSCFASNILIAY